MYTLEEILPPKDRKKCYVNICIKSCLIINKIERSSEVFFLILNTSTVSLASIGAWRRCADHVVGDGRYRGILRRFARVVADSKTFLK